MRKIVIACFTVAAIAVFAVAFTTNESAGKTIKITEQQMKNVCGKKVETGGGQTGCTKKCGNTVCDYNCNKKDGCSATIFIVAPEPDKKGKPPTTGILDSGVASATRGPATTGKTAKPAVIY